MGVSVPFDGLAAKPTVVIIAMVAEIRISAASRTFVRDKEVTNERTKLILFGIFEILTQYYRPRKSQNFALFYIVAHSPLINQSHLKPILVFFENSFWISRLSIFLNKKEFFFAYYFYHIESTINIFI